MCQPVLAKIVACLLACLFVCFVCFVCLFVADVVLVLFNRFFVVEDTILHTAKGLVTR